jgi:hypothetical protein
LPAAEELRMLRAITQTALQEAGQRGVYRAAFRGFRIDAVRRAAPCGYGVTIAVSYGGKFCAGGVLNMSTPVGHDNAVTADEICTEFDARLWESIAVARVI